MSAYPQHELAELLDCADTGTWGDEGVKGSDNPVLRSSNIQDSKLDLTEYAWRRIPQKHIEMKTLVDGDIIVTMSSGSPALIGKCCIFRQPPDTHTYLFSNFTLRLRPNGTLLDSKWLHYWLSSPRGRTVLEAMNNTTSGLRNLNRKLYLTQKIPLPPLEEQKRIAAILDKADAVRRKRQESIRLTEEFLKSVFLDMFGDPVINPNIEKLPDGWERCTVNDLRAIGKWTCIGGPFGSNLTSSDYRISGVPVIRGSNLSTNDCFVSEDDFVYVSSIKAIELVQNTAYPGDIIFTQRGTLGQVGMLRKKFRYDRYIISQSQMKLTPNDELVDPIWLVSFFQAPMAQRVIENRTLSTGVPHINLGILREFPVNLPPISEQQRYSALHMKVMKAHKKQLDTLESSCNLFSSLVQRAFKGEL